MSKKRLYFAMVFLMCGAAMEVYASDGDCSTTDCHACYSSDTVNCQCDRSGDETGGGTADNGYCDSKVTTYTWVCAGGDDCCSGEDCEQDGTTARIDTRTWACDNQQPGTCNEHSDCVVEGTGVSADAQHVVCVCQ